jgi:class 3 adenylate cyclase/tetratricopeptide (TPR) repeat protein
LSACSSCGAELNAGDRFCSQCGTPQSRTCPTCGLANPSSNRFCPSCGTALDEAGDPAAAETISGSERRLVTVLFADLVGFTTLSEHRDPEEVRELLSSYFDRCRALIERYGGTVEKFIGDAVMAVWGTPIAREDDAERAVRAAMALTQAVTTLGQEVQMPELRVRAGVLTGNAAVEVGAESEGMVLGDTVNTAARLQSLAAPGTVLVDDVTHRASEAAIEYEDAGTRDVKGREQPVHAWRALRVVAGVGGARRSVGLEAPFVGRQRQLETIIEVAESSAAERRARLVAVVGDAGSGKSRLLWEFFKHVDGLEEVFRWHQGRCLSYGEGVSYWALAEMVRSRIQITEEEDPAVARDKLRDAVEEFVSNERERRLVEPRLAHLLRLEERPDADRADLFSGWRLFFERISDAEPVVLAFEDLQWADSGLLDFIDYLLEWSADHPIFVLALGRQELRERRAGWEPLTLEPLGQDSIATILDELAPGLPRELVDEIGTRSEGIPLYAVETIRMLQDRGMLVQDGPRYKVTGDVSDLDVPETLQALVASRLDGLSSSERSLLQDASVLGQSFSAAAAAEISGRREADVIRVLDALVAKQVLARDDDPRSPERGQYVFLQALLRTVAYGTLSRRARKERHVAAARHLERTWPGEARDIAEVLASHYLEAIRADADAEDVAVLRASARETLIRAGRSAASLALGSEADRYFEQAAELVEDDLERAELLEQAGRALRQSGDSTLAEERLRAAVELYERNGNPTGGTAGVTLGNVLAFEGRLEESTAVLERFRPAGDDQVDPVVRARALTELGRVLYLMGNIDEPRALFDEALTTLELAESWTYLAEAFLHRCSYLAYLKRLQEGFGVLHQALELARAHDLPAVELRAHYLLAAFALERDRLSDAVDEVQLGLLIARERGDRANERNLLSQEMAPLVCLGRWEEVIPIAESLLTEVDIDSIAAAAFAAQVASGRGSDQLLTRCRQMAEGSLESEYVDARVCAALVLARTALDRGESGEALERAESVLREPSTGGEFRVEAYALCVESAIALRDGDAMSRLISFVDSLAPAIATPLLRACRLRALAELAHRAGDETAAAAAEDDAATILRGIGARPMLATALVEKARRRDDPAVIEEARAIYAELGATRWLARTADDSGVAA